MSGGAANGTGEVIERALALSDRGRQDAARQLVISVASESVSNPRWRQVAGLIELRSGRYDAARDHFGEAIALQPQGPQHWFNLAAVEYRAGLPENALKAINTSLELDPNDGAAHLFAADILLAAGDAQGGGAAALQAHEQAQRLGVDPGDAAETLVRIHLACGRQEKAKQAALDGLGEAPGNTRLQNTYAKLLGESSADQAAAGEVLRSVLASSPTNTSARTELLRRLHTNLVRTRTAALAALVLAGFVFWLPRPAWIPVALAGAAVTAAYMTASGTTAKRILGRAAYTEYVEGHPGVRWGRPLALAAGVIAWLPPLIASGGTLSPTALTVLVAIVVLVGSALAWGGGTIVATSLSRDEFDPDLPVSAFLQRELWIHRYQGASRTAAGGSSLGLAFFGGAVSTFAPAGVGQATWALGLGALLATAADVGGRIGLARAAQRGRLGHLAAGEIKRFGVGKAITGSVLLLGFAVLVALSCLVAGHFNLSKPLSGTGVQAPAPTERPAPSPGRTVPPSSWPAPSVPTFSVPPMPSIQVPTFSTPAP